MQALINLKNLKVKKIVLMMMVVLIVGGGLKAQKRDTIYSDNKSLPDGFIGMSPKGDSTFRIVQVEAEFPGGLAGWKKYLEQNLNTTLGAKYIKIPKGEPSAKAKVTVNFIVDKYGNIGDVNADSISISTVHKKLVAEAIRVVKEGPRWIPAWQNGHNVAYRARQAITFIAVKE